MKQLAEESNGLVSQYSCRDGQKDFFRNPALSLGSDPERDNKGALRHGLGRVRASLQIQTTNRRQEAQSEAYGRRAVLRLRSFLLLHIRLWSVF